MKEFIKAYSNKHSLNHKMSGAHLWWKGFCLSILASWNDLFATEFGFMLFEMQFRWPQLVPENIFRCKLNHGTHFNWNGWLTTHLIHIYLSSMRCFEFWMPFSNIDFYSEFRSFFGLFAPKFAVKSNGIVFKN